MEFENSLAALWVRYIYLTVNRILANMRKVAMTISYIITESAMPEIIDLSVT
ncbi:MAG TPA: hypothetical protein VD710_10165 [Nitrososphaeraceae archaeon]|nr:hypothetical protein [Nitrososphaeraceae archaeon]